MAFMREGIDRWENEGGRYAPVTRSAAWTVAPEGPLVLCFDGSADARRAIERAGALFGGRRALVVTVWRPIADLDGFAWSGATMGEVNAVAMNRAAEQDGTRTAQEGAWIARKAGLAAEPLAVESSGPVWRTIVEIADSRDAAAIVMGSRGHGGVRSMLLGSVSGAVTHHAERPTMVVRERAAAASTR
jgi:nucleotide-binding universal stress UspA family protein